MTPPTPVAPSAEAPPVAGRWIAMSILLVANFMNLIDVTIVNVALPSLQEAFGATSSQIEWVVAVYILSFALLLLPAGRLGDILGRRRMFLIGVTLFTLGSALCGLAGSIEGLVAARVFQALGAASMTPQTLAIIPVIFAPKDRGAAFALTGLTAGMAAVAGPILGGWLIEANIWGLGWRPIFLVNIPVGIVAVLLALRFLPRVPGHPGAALDLVGTALAGITLFCVIFPLIEGRQVGWPWWCFAMIAAALPLAVIFFRWLRHRATQGRAQVIPWSLFANRNFVLGTILSAMLFSGVPGFFLVFALYLQTGYGLSPLQSGMTTVPFSLGVFAASFISGRLGPRWLRPRITAGAMLLAGAMIALRWQAQGMGEEMDRLALAPALLAGGLGLGTAISPLFQTILAHVGGRDTGAASGGLQAFQQMGSVVGLAIMGEIFFASLGSDLSAGVASHAEFGLALSRAVLYNVATFLVLAALVWLLPPPGTPAR